ncbi:unnamed protein product [Toxocara canis]|uniref:Secreted protein n=1 Tax=Toxocara canis TaxID=6265 RepID=A0A183UY16_TOXCA|nr:unnamed protein product [Toxocara canis]
MARLSFSTYVSGLSLSTAASCATSVHKSGFVRRRRPISCLRQVFVIPIIRSYTSLCHGAAAVLKFQESVKVSDIYSGAVAVGARLVPLSESICLSTPLRAVKRQKASEFFCRLTPYDPPHVDPVISSFEG